MSVSRMGQVSGTNDDAGAEELYQSCRGYCAASFDYQMSWQMFGQSKYYAYRFIRRGPTFKVRKHMFKIRVGVWTKTVSEESTA